MANEFIARKGLISNRSSSFDETLRVSGSISSPVEAFLTASWAKNTVSSSYAVTASYVLTASFVETASWANNVVTAQTASYVVTSQTASFVATASWAVRAVTASYAINASTASYVDASVISYLGTTGAVKTGSFTCTTANTWYELTFERDPETSSYWTRTANTGQFTCSVSGYYNFYVSAFLQKTGGSAAVGGIRVLKDNVQITGSYTSYTFASNNVGQILATNLSSYVASGSNYLLQVAADSNGSIQVAAQPIIGTGTYNHSARVEITRL